MAGGAFAEAKCSESVDAIYEQADSPPAPDDSHAIGLQPSQVGDPWTYHERHLLGAVLHAWVGSSKDGVLPPLRAGLLGHAQHELTRAVPVPLVQGSAALIINH